MTEEPTTESPTPSRVGGRGARGLRFERNVRDDLVVVLAIALHRGGRRRGSILRSRRPSATMQEAFVATAAAGTGWPRRCRHRLRHPAATEALIDQADQKLRAAQISREAMRRQRAAVDHSLSALAEAREALGLRAASAGSAHASGSDIEARLLRSLATLDAALGALGTAAGIRAPPQGRTGHGLRGDRSEARAGTLPRMRGLIGSVDELQTALGGESYLADRGLATSIHLSLSLDKPLLLEGEAGVGKTEVAKVLSSLLGRRLIRLQCYEGIDASQALYEWNYSRQLIAVRAMDAADAETHVQDLFGPDFLVERPLLAAIRAGSGAVLLVDELDRADDEFEAFLLEVLSEFAVTIPEIGRIAAETPPAVVVTSNRTRELHDALKRRCLYHWIDHPDLEREIQIVRVRAPHVSDALARDVANGRPAAPRDGSGEAAGRRRDDRLGERARVPGGGAARPGRSPPTRSARS